MAEQPKFGIWPYILPMVAFMLVSMLEPTVLTPQQEARAGEPVVAMTPSSVEESSDVEEYYRNQRQQLANRFFLIYAVKVLITTGLLVLFWRSYVQQFPLSVTWLSIVVGVVGILVWVVLSEIGLEQKILGWFTSQESSLRSQFNPFDQFVQAWQLYGFLAVRFFGLVIMVPICEELLLRGFLMRYIESPNWWSVSLARLSLRALVVAPIYGLLTHPVEALAAIAWFSMVTWLVCRTGKFWDAVMAHAVTNLLLGIYVCVFSQWQLW